MRIGLAGDFVAALPRGCDTVELAACLLRAGHDVVPWPRQTLAGMPQTVADMFTMDPARPLDMMVRVGDGQVAAPRPGREVQWIVAHEVPDTSVTVAMSDPAHRRPEWLFVPRGVDASGWMVDRAGTGLGLLSPDTGDTVPEWVTVGGDPPMTPAFRRDWYSRFDVWARTKMSYGLDRYAIEYMATGGVLVAPKGTVDFPDASGIVEYAPGDSVGDAMEAGLSQRRLLSGRAVKAATQMYSMDDVAKRLVEAV